MVSMYTKSPSEQKVRFSNKWIDNRRLKRKMSPSMGALVLNNLEEGGKWKKEEWAYKKTSTNRGGKDCVGTNKICYLW